MAVDSALLSPTLLSLLVSSTDEDSWLLSCFPKSGVGATVAAPAAGVLKEVMARARGEPSPTDNREDEAEGEDSREVVVVNEEEEEETEELRVREKET